MDLFWGGKCLKWTFSLRQEHREVTVISRGEIRWPLSFKMRCDIKFPENAQGCMVEMLRRKLYKSATFSAQKPIFHLAWTITVCSLGIHIYNHNNNFKVSLLHKSHLFNGSFLTYPVRCLGIQKGVYKQKTQIHKLK